jgi:defect-in-organelle-trafficking protein DotD
MSAKHFALSSLIFLLMSCAPPPPVVSRGVIPEDGVDIKLAEAAASVSKSLEDLAAVEKAVHPNAPLPPPPNPASIGMGRLASVNWTGPIEPLIRKIAAITGYKVRTIGKCPAIPAIVSISARNTPLADILRDASYQAAKKTDIVIYPRSRVIEIRYL